MWALAVHIAASDKDFEEYATTLPAIQDNMHLLHFCIALPCSASTSRGKVLSHVEKFRLLHIRAAKKLPHGQDALLDFQATLAGLLDSAQEGEAEGGA